MNDSTIDSDAHERAWERIPWLVNGRLAPEEAQEVEAHAARCSCCREELALQARIHDAVSRDDSLAFASEAAYRKLATRIDAAPRERAVQRKMRWLVAALAIESIGLVAWSGWVWRSSQDRQALYVTLGESQRAAVSGASVRVVFRPESTLEDVQALLKSVNARVVDGPTESGVYTLELPQSGASSAAPDGIEALRASDLVRLAEPVDPPAASRAERAIEQAAYTPQHVEGRELEPSP
jgi:hypothetical protein